MRKASRPASIDAIGKFEAAHEGTLFLDEIGDLSLTGTSEDPFGCCRNAPSTASAAARRCRSTCASSPRPTATWKPPCEKNSFAQRSHYRLSVVNIQTPSLRETPEDIAILANHFLQKHCATMSVEPKQLSAAALDRLSAYHWPGNARQLENEIKRLVASVRGKSSPKIQVAIQSEVKPVPQSTHATPITGKSLFEAVDALERRMIQRCLEPGRRQQAEGGADARYEPWRIPQKLKKLTLAAEV